MQTFLPYKNFRESAKSLDYRRLGKQRVECLQILKAHTQEGYGWKNHPATKMWVGYTKALAEYAVVICDEWISRGYKDTCRQKILDIVSIDGDIEYPPWLGDERVHASHRANLLRKDMNYYGQHSWSEDPNTEYYWPTEENNDI